MRVTYRYNDTIERTVNEFCARALPGEMLPDVATYRIFEQPTLDATREDVTCHIETERGLVTLSLQVHESSWAFLGYGEPASASLVEATRTIESEDGSVTELSWDFEEGTWKPRRDS